MNITIDFIGIANVIAAGGILGAVWAAGYFKGRHDERKRSKRKVTITFESDSEEVE